MGRAGRSRIQVKQAQYAPQYCCAACRLVGWLAQPIALLSWSKTGRRPAAALLRCPRSVASSTTCVRSTQGFRFAAIRYYLVDARQDQDHGAQGNALRALLCRAYSG